LLSLKDAQATGEAFNLEREHPAFENMNIFALLDPDPDADQDPQPWSFLAVVE
jgi:hypothetical protein